MKIDVVDRILGEEGVNDSDRRFIRAFNTIKGELGALQKTWFSRPKRGTREHNFLWQHLDMIERDVDVIRDMAKSMVGKP